MRSIRLSLILYFLGLLALALGVASLLVYQSAHSTLQAKEEATAALIESRYKKAEDDENRQLDERLLEQSFALANRLKVDFQFDRLYENLELNLHQLGALSALNSPMGHLAAAPWLMQTTRYNPPLLQLASCFPACAAANTLTAAPVIHYLRQRDRWQWQALSSRRGPGRPGQVSVIQNHPFAHEIWRGTAARLVLVGGEADLPDRRQVDQYFQVTPNHYLWGMPLYSKSLAGRSFPYPEGFGAGRRSLHYWEWDTVELERGHPVRRVRAKIGSRAPWGGGLGGPGGPRGGPPPLHYVVQVATDLSWLDERLAIKRAERETALSSIREETQTSLARLRGSLGAIAFFTFVGVIAGTAWLVWAGLWPLKKLSDAVGKLSPKDFQLTLEPASLPVELRPVTEKLTTALDALGKAFRREKQAAADISHELRTPLAAMLTTCELALRRERTAEKYREMFSDCLASAHYLHNIVERLLTLARLDAGVDRVKPQQVDVSQVADQCAAVIRPLAEAQGLTLTVEKGGEARTTTDPDKLREIINNLLHNAIQYNRPAGSIGLAVSRDNGHVRFEVSDTGIGIAPEARDRIFERFYRADPSRNTDGLHAGLGLAIVKEYIDVMGGTIEVRSQEGAGTVFRVELPAAA